MPMDDLYKALNMFQSGVKDLATSRAVMGANEEVRRIKASELDANEKQAQFRQTSDNLMSQLIGLGASPATVEQAGQVMRQEPSGFEQALKLRTIDDERAIKRQQVADEAAAGRQERAYEFKTKEGALDRAAALERTKAGVGGREAAIDRRATLSLDRERRKVGEDYKKEFLKSYKGLSNTRQAAQKVLSLTNSSDTGTVANAVALLSGRQSGNVGNPTDSERRLFYGRQDIQSRLQRFASMNLFDKMPEEDLAELKGLAQKYLEVTEEGLQESAEMQASMLESNDLWKGTNRNQLIQMVSGKKVNAFREDLNEQGGSAGASSASGPAPAQPGSTPRSRRFKPFQSQ